MVDVRLEPGDRDPQVVQHGGLLAETVQQLLGLLLAFGADLLTFPLAAQVAFCSPVAALP